MRNFNCYYGWLMACVVLMLVEVVCIPALLYELGLFTSLTIYTIGLPAIVVVTVRETVIRKGLEA